LPQDFRFDRAILLNGKQTPTDSALICNDDEFEPFRFQTPQCFRDAGENLYLFRIRTVIRVLHNSPVAIDEDRW
jgi:hypothetical protein